jgi:hypothetical protein
MLKHQTLMVHNTSPRFIQSGGRPTSGYSRLGDRPELYISQSISRHACWLDNQPAVEDSQAMD